VLTIKQRHFAEIIAAAQFSQSKLVSVEGLNANPDFPPFNYVHRVSLLTVAEQKSPGLGINARQQLTQFVGRLVVEGFKQRHLAQCVDRHVRKTNGTVHQNSGNSRCREARIATASRKSECRMKNCRSKEA